MSPSTSRPVTILAFGDSLTAGYGVRADMAFPAQLERLLRAEGLAVTVVNAGVSGDTTAGGLARLAWSLADPVPDMAIVELGANDALRGVDPAFTEANLEAIIIALQGAGVPVLLAGMRAPFNMGGDYAVRFNAIFPRLAEKYKVALYPFFLEGAAGDPALNQSDGIHPNEAGTTSVTRNILPMVRDLVRSLPQGRVPPRTARP